MRAQRAHHIPSPPCAQRTSIMRAAHPMHARSASMRAAQAICARSASHCTARAAVCSRTLYVQGTLRMSRVVTLGTQLIFKGNWDLPRQLGVTVSRALRARAAVRCAHDGQRCALRYGKFTNSIITFCPLTMSTQSHPKINTEHMLWIL